MSYFVNTNLDNETIHCEKCLKKIGIAKGFYSQWGRILCVDCQEAFIEFVKEKYNEFIQPERLNPETREGSDSPN